ncbi:hypothetical protein DITRI_Ditri15bG0132700 [Diplodiscus trichospermus]
MSNFGDKVFAGRMAYVTSTREALNSVAHSFVKAAGIGAIQAVAKDACLMAVEGTESSNSSDIIGVSVKNKKHGFPDLRGMYQYLLIFIILFFQGETNRKSLEAMNFPVGL